MKRILGVIPARGGSKGIKNKNIRPLNNKPLIAYTINAAQQSKALSDCIVSTDSLEIKGIAESYGAKVPFLRPKYLSHDTALAIPTIQHAVENYEKDVGYEFDYVVMLQPTTPLRTSDDIDSALLELIEQKADSTISVVDVDNNHPWKMKIVKDGYLHDYIDNEMENPPRQTLPKIYIVNGAIYATKRNVLMLENSFKGKTCIPFIMTSKRSVNIDNIEDFITAEYFLNL